MRWSYKTVHFCLKKDGLLGSSFLDEDEIEYSLNEYGKSGWELVSLLEVNDGVIAVFKQPFGYGLPEVEEETAQERQSVMGKMSKERTPDTPPKEIVSEESPTDKKPLKKRRDMIQDKPDDRGVGGIRID